MEYADNFDPEIEQRLTELNSPVPKVREAAVKRLGELRAGTRELIQALSDRNGKVRSEAANALGHAPAEMRAEVIDHLLSAIDDSNKYVASAAIFSLGSLKAEECYGELVMCLEDGDPFVIFAAITVLGNFGNPQVSERLVNFLDYKQAHIRRATVRALRKLGYREAARKILDDFQELASRTGEHLDAKLAIEYGETLLKWGIEEAIPIIRQLEDRDEATVVSIIALARSGNNDVGEMGSRIEPFLDSNSIKVKIEAIKGIRTLGYRAAIPKLLTGFQELVQQDPTNYSQSHFALAQQYTNAFVRLDAQEAIPVLLEAAQNSVGFRTISIEALRRLRAYATFPALIDMLSAPDSTMKSALLKMMVGVDSPVALLAARPLLKDRSSAQSRNVAIQVLTKWKDASVSEQVRNIARRDSSPLVRIQAVNYLIEVMGADSIADLIALATDTNTYIRRAVAGAFKNFERLDEEAFKVLESMAREDSDEESRNAAIASLQHHNFSYEDRRTEVEEVPRTTFPAAMRPVRLTLLSQLREWQNALPQMMRHQTEARLVEADRALTTLILELQEATD